MPTGKYHAAGIAVVIAAVAVLVVALENVAIAAFFGPLERLTTDFSPVYLSRRLDTLAARRDATVFLGDSVLWGFRLRPDETAISRLSAAGCFCVNFAFKGGNAPNDFALVRLLQTRHAHPKRVIIEVNQRVFNPADGEYKSLHPAIAALAADLFSPADRVKLGLAGAEAAPGGRLDHLAAHVSLLYAMRSDIRETMFDDVDTAPTQRPTPDLFEGTYDLTPLDPANVAVHFLEETVEVLRSDGIEVIAFLTPTNHALLHSYIDTPEYRANGAYLRTLLERRGARVLDLDATFPSSEFFDNDHLTPAGQQRLAARLGAALSH